MEHTSWIELDRSALRNNIAYMQDLAGPGTRYSMVVKANAYGHGIEEIVPLVECCGVDHFSVFSVHEARRVHAVAGEACDLMIMGWIDEESLDWAVGNEVSFFCFTPERLEAALATARRLDRRARLHVELETGMHRTGFNEEQLGYVVEMLQENEEHLFLEGLCTHFAGAESSTAYDRVRRQIRTFHRLVEGLAQDGVRPRYRHAACTAGLMRFPEARLDMVRVGIANYGLWPSAELRLEKVLQEGEEREDPLQRVLTWKSQIMSVNEVPEDEYVSYGRSYLTNRPSKIATVPVGYGYGFSRTLSNAGHVLVQGRRVAVIGSVNMNQLVIDVTDIDEPAVGDEVVLIGRQGLRVISVSSFSEMNDSLNYELLTRLPDHIPRLVVG